MPAELEIRSQTLAQERPAWLQVTDHDRCWGPCYTDWGQKGILEIKDQKAASFKKYLYAQAPTWLPRRVEMIKPFQAESTQLPRPSPASPPSLIKRPETPLPFLLRSTFPKTLGNQSTASLPGNMGKNTFKVFKQNPFHLLSLWLTPVHVPSGPAGPHIFSLSLFHRACLGHQGGVGGGIK